MSGGVFDKRELMLATVGALAVQTVLAVLFVAAGDSSARVKPAVDKTEELVPIEVQPVLDELPLLKLGSKQPKRELPDMWKKREPVPVRRLEERSAPSEDAVDDPEEIPDSELADEDHQAPTEDDEIVKEATDQLDSDEPPEDAPTSSEEGAADGVAEGTETDPLKAQAVNLYKRTLQNWFAVRFSPPKGEIPCEELKNLSTGVAVQVGGNRAISGFSIISPSGNAIFDRKVYGTLSSLTGQQLPPPPPLYPDILDSTVYPRLSGGGVSCP